MFMQIISLEAFWGSRRLQKGVARPSTSGLVRARWPRSCEVGQITGVKRLKLFPFARFYTFAEPAHGHGTHVVEAAVLKHEHDHVGDGRGGRGRGRGGREEGEAQPASGRGKKWGKRNVKGAWRDKGKRVRGTVLRLP